MTQRDKAIQTLYPLKVFKKYLKLKRGENMEGNKVIYKEEEETDVKNFIKEIQKLKCEDKDKIFYMIRGYQLLCKE